MVRGRKKIRRKKSTWSGSVGRRRRPKSALRFRDVARRFFIVAAVVLVLAGIVVTLWYLDENVKSASPLAGKTGRLELMAPPDWLSSPLLERIVKSAGGDEFPLAENTAKLVAQNLQALPWLYKVQVQITDQTVRIECKYRRPAATVTAGDKKYYLAPVTHDDPLFSSAYRSVVVLDYLPLNNLPIVEIKGFAGRRVPPVGAVWQEDDIVSAVQLLELLDKRDKMDKSSANTGLLLFEIESIDVSNFAGRRNSSRPHTVLYATDGTEIWWGAAYGQAARYLEATEKEKLATLYSYYNKQGTVRIVEKGIGRYIDIRQPQITFPRPGQ